MKRGLVTILIASIIAIGTVPTVNEVTTYADNSSAMTTSATSGQCGYSATWNLSDDGTLKISGKGDLYQTNIPWKEQAEGREKITSVIVDEGITSLPAGAFSYCEHLKNVALPLTLKSIPSACFASCPLVTQVSLPENLQSIGNSAFDGCQSLESVTIPAKVSAIGYSAFYGCKDLGLVSFDGENIKQINESLFKGCINLKEINLPKSISYIGRDAFENCDNLTKIYVPDLVDSIGDRAFDHCSKLSSISLPHKLKRVGESAFSYCTSLNSVVFRGSPRQYKAISTESDNDNLKNSKVTYEYKQVKSLTLPKTLTVPLNSRADLKAEILPTDAADQYLEWTSSNTDVASLDQEYGQDKNGTAIEVYGDKAGSATITAKSPDGNTSASCVVTVAVSEPTPKPDGQSEEVPVLPSTSDKEGMSASPEEPPRPNLEPTVPIERNTNKSVTINIYNTTIGLSNPAHGTTKITPNSDGKTVTVTTKPDAGYELDAIQVSDVDGKKITVRKMGKNSYQFTTVNKGIAVVTTYKKKGTSGENQKSTEEQIKNLQKEIDNLKKQLNRMEKGNNIPGTVVVNRLYNSKTGEHFYTGNAAERNYLVKLGWKDEGQGWREPSKSDNPIYRLYNSNAGDHHYTTSKGERDILIKHGWKDEGISLYSADKEGKPVYRLYNPNAKTGTHTYTMNPSERQLLIKLGWKPEGIAWYAK